MSIKKVALIVVITIFATVAYMMLFGAEHIENISNHITIKKINNALEMSLNLESATLETNILEGSYTPKGAPKKIETEFKVNNPNKDKNSRNINFDVVFYYKNNKKEVNNISNYEGIYLNMYYPYPNYNKINMKTVKDIEVNKVEDGTEYIVHYQGTHLSRRYEWEYCKVEDDYEYFFINKDGVIVEYKSDTYYKQKDEETSEWIEGESSLEVKLTDYTLIE